MSRGVVVGIGKAKHLQTQQLVGWLLQRSIDLSRQFSLWLGCLMSSTRVRSGKCRSSTARVSFGTHCSQLPWWPLRTEAAAGRLRRADSRRMPAAALARTMSSRGACCGQAASGPNRGE